MNYCLPCLSLHLLLSRLAVVLPAGSGWAPLIHALSAEDIMQDRAWLCDNVLCIAKYISVSCIIAELCYVSTKVVT